MFGEGSMLHEGNFKISEPQNSPFLGFDDAQPTDNENNQPRIDFEKSFTENEQNSEKSDSEGLQGLNSTPLDINPDSDGQEIKKSAITFNPYTKKRIVNIIVYYDDNSFESFVPGTKD